MQALSLDYRGNAQSNASLKRDFRETFLEYVNQIIRDEKFVRESRSKDGGNGFTRTRKIPFIHLIVLITQGLSRSIQRELNSFYQKVMSAEFSLQHVTKGAFTQARSKLKPEAFKVLNQVGISSFYRDAPYRQWRGFRLLSIDGSTCVLPKHTSIAQEFGTVHFGPYADSPQSVARTSVLYDVLNFTVLDAEIDRYEVSERNLAYRHIPYLDPGKDIVILDRGYPSLPLMFALKQKGVDYCIRMREDWWLEVRKMLSEEQTDKEVTFRLSKNDRHLLQQYDTQDDRIQCRLVVIDLPGGGKEILCTSLVNQEAFPYECFLSLYQFRWNVEEGYKLFKTRLQLEAFSGKTANAVKQDFFAKIFMMTTTAVLAFPVEEKLKKDEQQSKRKHPVKINRVNAVSMIKENAYRLLNGKTIRQVLDAFDTILKRTIEIVRPNRKYPRNKIKKKPPSNNYKQL